MIYYFCFLSAFSLSFLLALLLSLYSFYNFSSVSIPITSFSIFYISLCFYFLFVLSLPSVSLSVSPSHTLKGLISPILSPYLTLRRYGHIIRAGGGQDCLRGLRCFVVDSERGKHMQEHYLLRSYEKIKVVDLLCYSCSSSLCYYLLLNTIETCFALSSLSFV